MSSIGFNPSQINDAEPTSSNQPNSSSILPFKPPNIPSQTPSSRWQQLKEKCTQLTAIEPSENFGKSLAKSFGFIERYKKENWGINNPKNIELLRNNTYVQEMWSSKYFITCKKDAEETFNTLGRAALHLGGIIYHLLNLLSFGLVTGTNITDSAELFGKNLLLFLTSSLNLIFMIVKLIVNVEILNFIKGVIGVIFSAISLVFHTVVTLTSPITIPIMYFLGWIAQKLGYENEWGKNSAEFVKANAKCIVKDIIAIFASAGHAIPSWLPIVLTILCPPVGIGLAALKIAAVGTRFIGITDVAAYGGTFALLRFDLQKAQKTPASEKAQEIISQWNNMKKELDPRKSKEGAILTAYAMNMLFELTSTVVDLFVPGIGTTLKYGSYAAAAASAATLRGYGHYKGVDSEKQEIASGQKAS